MHKINRDSLPYILWITIKTIRTRVDSILAFFLAKYWKIFIGKGCIFRGIPVFRRFPLSTIIIGKSCTFNSKSSVHQGGISRPCALWTLSNDSHIQIGDKCGFSGTVISAEKSIIIGNNVRCGTNTRLMDSDMHSDDSRVGNPAPIIIGDNVWIGMGTVILKGVTIGDNTLIGANSLVNKSIPDNVVAAGTPAKILRELT